MNETRECRIEPNNNPKYKWVVIGFRFRYCVLDLETAKQIKAEYEQAEINRAQKAEEKVAAAINAAKRELCRQSDEAEFPGIYLNWSTAGEVFLDGRFDVERLVRAILK